MWQGRFPRTGVKQHVYNALQTAPRPLGVGRVCVLLGFISTQLPVQCAPLGRFLWGLCARRVLLEPIPQHLVRRRVLLVQLGCL